MALIWGNVFLCSLLVFSSVSGETAPCITSREECVKTGFSSISVMNNRYLCCTTGFSLSINGDQCSCKRTSTARNCDKGPKACQGAGSLSSDGAGNTMCCPQGYSMTNKVTSINGMVSKSCTCSQGFGGSSSFQIISGNSSFNSTESRQRWQRWRQKFQTAMRHSMASLRNNMQSLRNRMRALKTRLSSAFGNFFQG